MSQKVEISIRRKRPVSRSGAPSRKGPLDVRHEPDYLKRRLKKGGIITFYDMAQKSDGSGGWIQNNYRYDPGFTIHPSPDPDHSDDQLRLANPLTIANIRDFEASILTGIAPENFATTFRHILKSDGNSFPLFMQNNAGDFTFDSPEWIEEGLKVKASDLVAPSDGSMSARAIRLNAVTGGFEPLVKFMDVSNSTKFTTMPTYASPSVAFNPGVNDKYFFIPNFASSGGISSISTGTHSSEAVYLNNFHHIQPRNFSNPNYIPSSISTEPSWAEALGYHTSLPGTQTFTVVSTPRGPFNTQTLVLSNGGTFPIGAAASVSFSAAGSILAEQQQWAGQLIGIIQQGDTFYYMWATSDF